MTYEQFLVLKTWMIKSHHILNELSAHPSDKTRIEALKRQQDEADATAVTILVERNQYNPEIE